MNSVATKSVLIMIPELGFPVHLFEKQVNISLVHSPISLSLWNTRHLTSETDIVGVTIPLGVDTGRESRGSRSPQS